jgi:hypothetical protein
MRLLAVRSARSIWLIPQYFLNPKGLFLRPAALQLKDRYQFLKSPFDNNTIGTQEVKYEQGAFVGIDGAPIQIESLVLHPNGIVVDTHTSTDAGDAFLTDIGNWLVKDFGLPSFADAPIKRLYASELNVILEKQPSFLNPRLKPFVDAVSAHVGDEITGQVDLLSFQLSTDQTRSPTPNTFRIDREVSTSFRDNRYYSYAPLRTDEHLKLLQKLEDCL